MLFNNVKKPFLIIECTLINGKVQYYYVERLPANNLPHLDTTNQPLRCYQILNFYLGNKVVIKNTNKVINLHLNQTLSYANVTKQFIVMDKEEFDTFYFENCKNGCVGYLDDEYCNIYLDDTGKCISKIKPAHIVSINDDINNISLWEKIKKLFKIGGIN